MKRLASKKSAFFLLIALAGAYFFLKDQREEKMSLKSQSVFPQFDSSKIDSIEISSSSKTTNLRKINDAFVVVSEDNDPADEAAVKGIISEIKSLNRDELVSNNRANWSVFNVDEKAVHVKFKSGRAENEFWIGKTGPDLRSTYLRVSADPNTYLTYKSLRNAFLKNDYRDLKILKIDESKITRVELSYTNNRLVIIKDQGKWRSGEKDGKELATEKITSLLDKIAALKGNGLDHNIKENVQNFAHPYLVITLNEGITETKIEFGSKNKDGDYYTRNRQKEKNIYTVASYNLETFPRTFNDIEK